MRRDEAQAFYDLLDVTYDLIGVGAAKIISGPAKAIFFEDLERYPLELIRAALGAHRMDPVRGKFTPKPADIEHQINIRRPVVWLTADEAWARTPKIEAAPALMTTEMVQALAAAAPLLAEGEKVGARMAFKGAYDRLVDRAKLDRRGPVYFVSPGGSYDDQQAVVAEGVRQGLLVAPVTVPLIENGKRTSGIKPDLKALLLSMQTKTMPSPEPKDYE